MKTSQFIIVLFFLIYGTFGFLHLPANDPEENSSFRSTTSQKASSILRDILKQETLVRFSMVQKIQNLVTVALGNKYSTEIVKKNLENIDARQKMIEDRFLNIDARLKMIEDRFLNFTHSVGEVMDDFREDQNATNIQLQNVPSLHQSGYIFPFDCFDIYNKYGQMKTGVYEIYPFNTSVPVQVLCDMDLIGGGWTVIQHRNRKNPHVNFSTTWDEYKRGFGDVRGNYWLGNDAIHELTTKYNNSLYIRFESTMNESFEVQYSLFSISDETDSYRLSLGSFSGNIVDAFRSYMVVGYSFFTVDKDNGHRCAATRKSGWWYDYCTHVNLNAPLFEGHGDVVWNKSITKGKDLSLSEMLIRRKY